MESKQIEILLEKYFEGQTSLTEEQQLKNYFSTDKVDPHLKKYQSIFETFKKEKEILFTKKVELPKKTTNRFNWISIAASVVLFFGMLFYFNQAKSDENLGTYSNPEEAFVATQKALKMISEEVNKGKQGITYLNEYEQTKKTIFK